MNCKRVFQQSVFGIAATIIGAASAFGQAIPVVINELVKQEGTATTAAVNPDTREFIEFYNRGATPVDLSNYTIRSTNLSTSTVTNDPLPSGATIAPGGYYTVAVGGRGIVGANHYITIGASEEFFPDAVGLMVELYDNSPTPVLVDALAVDAYRGTQLTTLTAAQLAEVGSGLQGRAESYNPSAAVVPNKTMTYARYRDGIDSNKNGRDFGYLPVTPGASNTLSSVPAHVVPNVDALPVGTLIADYNSSFVAPRVIAPGTVDVANPKAIAPSPQGGNAISAWDETGGGNVAYSKNYVNKFDLYAYLDTTALDMPTADWEGEWTAYGIGSTDPQFRTPNSNGLVPDAPQNTVGENGSTGIGWFYERFQNADTTTSFKLSLIDFGQGGNSVPAAQADQQWEIIQTFNLTPADSGWHRLSVDYNPTTGAVEAKFDDNTVNFSTATDLVGTFYAGYREGLTGVPAGTQDFVNRVRPATFDMIATVTNDANFDNDGDVDGRDFLIWQSGFGGTGNNAAGDANGDGQVTGADYTIWRSQFGTTGLSSAAGSPAPEPASLVLFACAVGLFAAARRQ